MWTRIAAAVTIAAELAAALDAAPESPDLLFLQAYIHHFSGRRAVGAAPFRYLLDLDPGHRAATAFLRARPAGQ